MKDIIIFGAGGMGREIIGLIENINIIVPTWNILGFLDDNEFYWGQQINGYMVHGGKDWLQNIKADIYLTCGIGVSAARKSFYNSIIQYPKVILATLVDPTASINKTVKIGVGSVICRNSTINIDSIIGNGVLLNTGASVGHDAVIGDFCTLLTSSMVSGSTLIGECCEIGSGAFVLQGKKITSNCTIAPLTAVLKNIDEAGLYSGNPARRFK